jgi:hypothetical protein
MLGVIKINFVNVNVKVSFLRGGESMLATRLGVKKT